MYYLQGFVHESNILAYKNYYHKSDCSYQYTYHYIIKLKGEIIIQVCDKLYYWL